MIRPDGIVDLWRTHSQARVGQILGEGGQGRVFIATAPGLGPNPVALKWYHAARATETMWASLGKLVTIDPPHRRFLWPLDLASARGVEGFGYAMALRPAAFVGMGDVLRGAVDVDLRRIARMGIELADSYLRLHAAGLCYKDISFGNVFVDPTTGAVLICDNDNVTIEGTPGSEVLGTPHFMAPEIFRGQASPSADTDLHSLAVLLFYLLMVHHPLEGRRELSFQTWGDAQDVMFGQDPVFIFDPTNADNAPVPGLHDTAIATWATTPRFLQDLFVQSFTVGLHDPHNGRVRESVWRTAMARLHDSTMRCPACGKMNVLDPDRQGLWRCWSCTGAIAPPLELRIKNRRLVLDAGVRVFDHHLTTSYDFETVVGEVERHPDRVDVLGLRNATATSWRAERPDGQEMVVEPGRRVALTDGVRIDFGGPTGIVLGPQQRVLTLSAGGT